MTNLFSVAIGGKYGFIDQSGQIVIAPKYRCSGDEFSEGLVSVGQMDPEKRKDRYTGQPKILWGFMDTAGDQVLPFQFDAVRSFSGGFAPVCVGNQWGYVGPDGQYLLEPQFDLAWEFSEGLATVELGSTRRVIDTKGNTVFEVTASRLGQCKEGLMCCENKKKWSFLDRTGTPVIELTCSAAQNFSEGLALVLMKGKIGYIDKQGKVAIKPQFGQAGNFSEGLAWVEFIPGGKHDFSKPQVWGYVDREGRNAFSKEFDGVVSSFSEGLAAVHSANRKQARYIDRTGEPVFKDVVCTSAAPFKNGLARICLDSGCCYFGYINRRGEYIWKPQG